MRHQALECLRAELVCRCRTHPLAQASMSGVCPRDALWFMTSARNRSTEANVRLCCTYTSCFPRPTEYRVLPNVWCAR